MPGYSEMSGYEVTLGDRTVEVVKGVDAYVQEGPLTTFFDTAGRDVIDAWAVRVLSLRTAEILMVRRTGESRPRATLPVLVRGVDDLQIAG